MSEPQNLSYQEAYNSLKRIQEFDITTLPRKTELGTEMCFEAAVPPATRLINLYKKLAISVLDDLHTTGLNDIKSQADADFNTLQKAIDFKAAQGTQVRDSIISQLTNRYNTLFPTLHPYISYSMHKATDFEQLETRSRAIIQGIQDQGSAIEEDMGNIKIEAQNALETIRTVAGEQGVSQQAIYFKTESDFHETEASKWFRYTAISAAILVCYALATFFIHKINFFSPQNTFETIQLVISKVLVFMVISYSLYFCSRNYSAHKHNSVVNKHRQNALVTYRAIVEAANETTNADIVLGQASCCIFSPQDTGYSRQNAGNYSTPSTPIEFVMKAIGNGASID